ncbi:MAG: hypothetical protein JO272_14005 [Pseudonocardiales bacterium]|nr:hypothetical protein [Pseudonocardiales bacterium]
MNKLAPLGSYELSAPDTWASLPVVEGDPGWTQDTAALLCDGEAVRVTLAAKLERTHPELIADLHLLLGAWVPDRSVPDIAGLMTVDWVLPDEGRPLDRCYYRGLIDPDRRSGHTVFNRQVDEVEVPAGPALLVREVIARRDSPWFPWRKTLQENVIYTVFPPGCSDALELTFVTFALDRGEELAADAAAVLDTLRVTLEEPPK